MSINKVMVIGMAPSKNLVVFARMNRDGKDAREQYPDDRFYYNVTGASLGRLKDVIHKASQAGVTGSIVFAPAPSDLVSIWMKYDYYALPAIETRTSEQVSAVRVPEFPESKPQSKPPCRRSAPRPPHTIHDLAREYGDFAHDWL